MRRRMVGITAVAALAAVFTLFGQAPALLGQAANPTIGTWKLNLAKSRYDPANLAPKSTTTKIEAVGASIKNTTTGTDSKGKAISYSYTAAYDGKDYPISGTGTPSGGDTIALKRSDPNTVDSTVKKSGKVVQTSRTLYTSTLRTITSTGTSDTGQPTHNVSVYEKQ
jgi:hypothetical protein